MARPKSLVSKELVYQLAGMNCSWEEIAAACKCSVATLQRRFEQVFKEGRENGRMSLKRRMFATAMGYKGKKVVMNKRKVKREDGTLVEEQTPVEIECEIPPNTVMQIFLSKNLLGYNDNDQGGPPSERRNVTHKWVVRKPTGEEVTVDKPEERPATDDFGFDQDL